MKRAIRTFITAGLLLSLTGCTMRLVDFTIISTKNIDLTRAASFQRGKSRITGKDEAMIIIFIPTGVPNIKEAIDRALEGVPGAVALVDGVLTSESWWFLFGMQGYVVEGTPLIDPALASNKLESNYMIAKIDRKGNLKEFRYVSADEYAKVRDTHVSRHKQANL